MTDSKEKKKKKKETKKHKHEKKDRKRKRDEKLVEGDQASPENEKKKLKKEKKKKEKKKKSKDKKKRSRDEQQTEHHQSQNGNSRRTESSNNQLPFPHQYILAPMVGASELPFRLLCRKYGAQLAYTPMMSSTQFITDENYRQEIFQTCELDRPLVCHFSANRPQDFAQAIRFVSDRCDAIDLNLGCPQRTAYLGHFGSYLLDPCDRQLICDIVKAGSQASDKPVFVKIRLLETLPATIELCQQLRDAGASLIAIHARYRASWERKGPGARDGPALLDQVTAIKQAIPAIPIIANGNVITWEDVVANQTLTQADGIMSAEGILDNPALFLPRYGPETDNNKIMIDMVDPLELCHGKDDLSTSNGKHHKKKNDNPTADTDSNLPKDIQKKKRKLLKKLREIDRIQAKLDKKGPDSIIPEQQQKLQAKAKIQQELDQLEMKIKKVESQNGMSDSEAAHGNNDTKKITKDNNAVTNSNNNPQPTSVPLSTLYETANNKVQLAREYLTLAKHYGPTTLRTQIFHTRRILKSELTQYQLMEECLQASSPDDLINMLNQIQTYQDNPTKFVYDKQKAQQENEALERKKREEGKRKAFEARMMRKAKREGKLHDLEFYLRQGAQVPTLATIDRLRQRPQEEQLAAWKEHHSQHCLAFHLDSRGCQRGRTCAFLHVEAVGSKGRASTVFEEQDEVAG